SVPAGPVGEGSPARATPPLPDRPSDVDTKLRQGRPPVDTGAPNGENCADVAAIPLLGALWSLFPAGDAVVPPGEDVLGRTIVEVAVDGVDPATVDGLADLVGRPLTRPLARSLIESLWATDRYRDVRVEGLPVAGGVRLVVRLDLRRRIRTLDATGNDHMDLHEMRRAARFVPDSEEHPDLLNEMRGRIESAYAARGFPNASVDFEARETSDPARIALVAVVNEGEPTRIASVRLAGTPVYPQRMLLGELAVGPGDPWDQPALAEAVRRLLRFYRHRGYLLATASEPEVEPLDDGRVALTIRVEAGLPVTIVFGGNVHVTAGDLAVVVGLDEAPDLGPTGLGNACIRIVEHYRALGFPSAAAHWSVVDDSAGVPPPESLDQTPRDGFGEVGGAPPASGPPVGPVRLLRFRIREGPRLRVARIEWDGNEHLADGDLDGIVREHVTAALNRPALFQPFLPGELGSLGLSGEDILARSGALPPLLPAWSTREIFIEQAYREAAVRATQRYRAEGFLEAEVAFGGVRRDPGGRAIEPRFAVREGPRSLLGSVRVEGNEMVPVRDIEREFLVEAGGPVDEMLVEETRRAILELYASRGHLFAAVETRAEFTPDRTRVDLAYVVAEGPRVRVARIEVSGNEETSESLILGALSFGVGDVFTPDAAETSEQRLLRLGIFHGVTIAPAAPEVPEEEKTIVVQVRERPPQALELRAGFSTAEGVRGAFGYGYRNLFGYAMGLRLQLKLNYLIFFIGQEDFERHFDALALQDQLERSVTAGVNLPYLPGLGGLIGTQFDFANERDNRPFYGIDRTSAFLGLSTGWRKLLAFQLRGGIEHNDVLTFEGLPESVCTGREPPGASCLPPDAARQLRTPSGVSTFAVVRSSFTVDWRDSPFNPTRGIYASATAEFVRSFGAVDDPGTEIREQNFSNLVKASFLLSGYVPLVEEMVLALSGRFGRVFHLQDGSRTFADRYFYLGGFDTIRGLPQESLAAADLAADLEPEHVQPGGDVFVVARAELRFPLTDTVSGAVFADAGNLWRHTDRFDPVDLRYTAGAGLRIGTPIGPLTFDYGVNLVRREAIGEEFGALHFSIGMF
ncbi:MAG: POTRA domain-containing protein, partial [Myxococcota bacterium]|nr:POTRA domain-containing protein [Myxococcota bacterium]